MIEKAAVLGDAESFDLPRAMLEPDSLDFSFSGMKSAVLNILNTAKMKNENIDINNIAASFQQATIDVLVKKSIRALERYEVKTFALAGGVAANSMLRASLKEEMDQRKIPLIFPSPIFCTDNGAMIAMAGYFHFIAGDFADWKLNAVPGLNL